MHVAHSLIAFSLLMHVVGVADAQVLAEKDLRPDPDGMPGERVLQRTIDVGRRVKADVLIEVTNKGNGLLSVGGLALKVVDQHDDGALFAGGMAHVEFADIDGDGFKDLVVSGIAEYTDEKRDEVHERESFVFIYRYDAKAKAFKQSYAHASFKPEVGPRAKV
jgi:hypothetical protein